MSVNQRWYWYSITIVVVKVYTSYKRIRSPYIHWARYTHTAGTVGSGRGGFTQAIVCIVWAHHLHFHQAIVKPLLYLPKDISCQYHHYNIFMNSWDVFPWQQLPWFSNHLVDPIHGSWRLWWSKIFACLVGLDQRWSTDCQLSGTAAVHNHHFFIAFITRPRTLTHTHMSNGIFVQGSLESQVYLQPQLSLPTWSITPIVQLQLATQSPIDISDSLFIHYSNWSGLLR